MSVPTLTQAMKIEILLVIVGLVGILAADIHKRSSKCYGKFGCFDTDPPFFSLYRPLNLLPESPDHINVKFMLYTKLNANKVQFVSGDNITSSHFDSSKATKVVIHGYFDNGNKAWVQSVKDEYLKSHDVNVIIVDWGGGSKTLYTQATANTRLVGAIVADFINTLKSSVKAKPENFHLIGHSLGAHTAGYAGERIQHIGRITGLDPAEPYFQDTDIKVRLDPTDALFVDVIHSNGESLLKLGLGMKQACGHVDYYPNGGLKQPGCEKSNAVHDITIMGLPGGVHKFFACSHQRSHNLFIESINSKCPFEGYRCNSYDDFNEGKCIPCSGTGCGHMGVNGDHAKPTGRHTLVKYFLKTGPSSPFCRYHYKLELTFGHPLWSRDETGIMYVTLNGTKGSSSEIQLTEKHEDIKAGHTYPFVVTSPHDLGIVTAFDFRWDQDAHWYKPLDWNPLGIRHPTLFLSKLEVTPGETAKRSVFCPNDMKIEADKLTHFGHTGSC